MHSGIEEGATSGLKDQVVLEALLDPSLFLPLTVCLRNPSLSLLLSTPSPGARWQEVRLEALVGKTRSEGSKTVQEDLLKASEHCRTLMDSNKKSLV